MIIHTVATPFLDGYLAPILRQSTQRRVLVESCIGRDVRSDELGNLITRLKRWVDAATATCSQIGDSCARLPFSRSPPRPPPSVEGPRQPFWRQSRDLASPLAADSVASETVEDASRVAARDADLQKALEKKKANALLRAEQMAAGALLSGAAMCADRTARRQQRRGGIFKPGLCDDITSKFMLPAPLGACASAAGPSDAHGSPRPVQALGRSDLPTLMRWILMRLSRAWGRTARGRHACPKGGGDPSQVSTTKVIVAGAYTATTRDLVGLTWGLYCCCPSSLPSSEHR